MKKIRRRGLAVCMAATLIFSGFTVSAEEPVQTESRDVVENVATVSDGNADMDVETLEETDETEYLAENQIMLLAADDIASGIDGDITWVIDTKGKLTVTGTGDLSGNHFSSDFAWAPYCEQIISAELNVTGMTDATRLFYGCSNLTSVDVSNFDTSSVTYMGYMFYDCSSLTSVDVSNFDTSSVTSMWGMFYGCSSLTSVDVSNFDTSSVTYMGYMFYDCSSLTSVDVSNFDTSSVTDMVQMFRNCSSLTSVDVSNFDTSSVTNMLEMFYGCSSLTSVDVSNFDTSSVTDMGHMFYGCSSLTSVDVSNFDTSSVTSMGYMFYGCSSLTSVDVSNFDTSSVTYMVDMFYGCSSLTSVDVSNFDTSSVTDMWGMFYGCSSLTSVDVSNFDTSSVTDMGYMFSGCSSLTNIDVSEFNTGNVTDMGGIFWDCSSLIDLDVSGFNTENVVAMELMFHNCSSLVSLDIGGFDTGNVTNMNAMFAGCSSLTSLDVRGFNTSNVTHMGMMFSDCSGLTNLDVGGFDTDNVTSMNAMFSGCRSLTNLDVSGFNLSNVTEDSGSYSMFTDCDSLLTLESPCNVNIVISLPFVQGTTWYLPDGIEVTELPQGLSYSVTLTRSGTPTTPQIITTTTDLNMADVVRVKYVPYSYTVETNADEEDTVTFSIEEGRLADGLQIYPATGEIYGVPLEAGIFPITVKATYGNPAYPPAYAELTLTVLDNTDDNVGVATDFGYDIIQPVIGFNMDTISDDGTQTLVSQGEYEQFRDVYIDGKKLTEGQEYTSAPGSTRITILNQTLADGGAGTHTLGIEFRTGDGTLKRAAQNYTVSNNSTGDSNGNTPEDAGNNESNVSNVDSRHNSNAGDSITLAAEDSQADFIIYTVEKGDSLWKIAVRFYGQGSSWRRIYEDNAAVIRNPGVIYAGQRLVIRLAGTTGVMPETSVQASDAAALEGTDYKVQRGDSLWTIASRAYGSGHFWNIIYEANRDIIADPERIRGGQVLAIPQR